MNVSDLATISGRFSPSTGRFLTTTPDDLRRTDTRNLLPMWRTGLKPFRSSVKARLQRPEDVGPVVFDELFRLLATLVDRLQLVGRHHATADGTDPHRSLPGALHSRARCLHPVDAIDEVTLLSRLNPALRDRPKARLRMSAGKDARSGGGR